MKLAAFIYAASLTPHALEPIEGASAYERCLSFIQSLPGLTRIVVAEGRLALPDCSGQASGGESGPKPILLRRQDWSLDVLLEELEKASADADALVFAWGDQPFLDTALARKMLDGFRRYRAEYCFADGYPLGLAVEILAPKAIGSMRKLAAQLPQSIERDSLFTVIQKDINAFDIETEISPLDLRDLRLTLACDTKRNSLLVGRLAKAGVKDAQSALEIIPSQQEILRTLPSFIFVQVASGCPQSCKLCPYPVFGGDILSLRRDMSRQDFASLMDQVVELCEDAVIDISLWGEPSLHEDIEGIIDEVLLRPSLSLIVETSGLGWKPGIIEALAGRAAGRIDWVVSLDAWSPELYAQLRGSGYSEAVAFAESLIGLFPGKAHVQMVRSQDNEAELEAFWRGWKKKTDSVIIQKYSRQACLLPERKVSDLSPLVRKPCWHLKRDMSVLVDGTIPLCRDFSHGDIVLGNAFSARSGKAAGLASAWDQGGCYHKGHIEACAALSIQDRKESKAEGSLSALPPACKDCDEWYTYNA